MEPYPILPLVLSAIGLALSIWAEHAQRRRIARRRDPRITRFVNL